MTLKEEIFALREEVSRLRERIAVLEVQRPTEIVRSPSVMWPPLQPSPVTVGGPPGWWQNGPTAEAS